VRTVTRTQQALARARERRIELDRDRAARDRRVEQAVAEVLMLLDEREQVQQRLAELAPATGQVLRRLQQEGITLAQAAKLCALEVAEVRQLTRTARGSGHLDPSTAGDGALADAQPVGDPANR
jgi:DNA-directed RNA polymerase specialized sigma24 family protein